MKHFDSFETKEITPEVFWQTLDSLNYSLKETLLLLSSEKEINKDMGGMINKMWNAYLKIIQNSYWTLGIPVSSFLTEDINRRQLLFLDWEKTDMQLVVKYLYEMVFTADYIWIIHRKIAQWEISEDAMSTIVKNITKFSNDFSEINEFLGKDLWTSDLQYDLLKEKLSDDENMVDSIINELFANDLYEWWAFLMSKKYNSWEELTKEEERYLQSVLISWMNWINFKVFEESLEVDSIENDAKILDSIHYKNWSYLWLLSRLLNAQYVYDAHRKWPWSPWSKSIAVRMGWKVWNFVKSSSKRWKEIASKGWKKATMKAMWKMASIEKQAIKNYLKNSMLSPKAKKEFNTLLKTLDVLWESAKKGRWNSVKSLLNVYSLRVTNVEKKFNFNLKSSIWVSSWTFVSEKYRLQLRSIERAKNKLAAIQGKIEKLKMKAKASLQKHNILAKLNPEEAPKYRKEAMAQNEKLNNEIKQQQVNWVKEMNKLDDKTIRSMAQKPWFVKSYIRWNKKRDAAWSLIESKKTAQKVWLTRKGLIWRWMISLMIYGAGQNAWENNKLRRFATDIWDAWVWFIPVAWGINDLIVFARWKDWNDRTLSPKELGERLGFGIVWLIPWVGRIIKIWKGGKKWKNALKMARIYDKISKAAYKTQSTYSFTSLWVYWAIWMWEMVHWVTAWWLEWLKDEPTEVPPPLPEIQPEKTEFEKILLKLWRKKDDLLSVPSISTNEKIEELLNFAEEEFTEWISEEEYGHRDSVRKYLVDEILSHDYYFSDSVLESLSSKNEHILNIMQDFKERVGFVDKINSAVVIEENWNRFQLESSSTDISSVEQPPSFIYPWKKIMQLRLSENNSNILSYARRNTDFIKKQVTELRNDQTTATIDTQWEITGALVEKISLIESNSKKYLQFDVFNEWSLHLIVLPLSKINPRHWVVDLGNDVLISEFTKAFENLLLDII